ncbi:ribonuclease III [Lysobacter sp. N42]|nr:ribonuclease III [Aliidiomarina sp. B3213]TCZ93442.1 ribonuclease III [Lysobacter sp. N42]
MNVLSSAIGYTFKNKDLLYEALTHRSAGPVHYERLEFLGDSLLGFFIAEALYQKFPKTDEGDLSRMRASLVCGPMLAKIAKEFNLSEYLNLGPGELKSGGFRRESTLSDVVEALIGGMYLDSGLDVCKSIVLSWYRERLEKIQPGQSHKDPKTRLQEWLQSRQFDLPDYVIESTSGKAHNQKFTVSCSIQPIENKLVGQGTSRRKAEQDAASKAYAAIEAKIANGELK